jgi:tripartite-type tricarboxylate transporter receptor subunit TctC
MEPCMKILAALLLLPALLGAQARAADYPSRPIKVVIPFTAGGQTDVVMRILAPKLASELGQPVVIDNKPGGGAQIAASAVIQAPADGYNLFVAPGGAFVLNPSLYKKLSYDPAADFQGVATLLSAPMVMFTNPAGNIGSMAALRKALASGEALNYASPGPGTAPHLFGHVLGTSTPGARLVHVPYRGAPQMNQAIMAKEVDLAFDAVPTVLGMVKNAQVKPLAIAADKRHPMFPDVPTLKEAGLPQITMDYWMGVVVKKGTAAPIVERLHAAFEKAFADPAVMHQFASLGYARLAMTPARFDELVRTELEKYRPIVRESGASID